MTALVPLLLGTAAGLWWMWPREGLDAVAPVEAQFAAEGVTTLSGTATEVETFSCTTPGVEGSPPTGVQPATCATVLVDLAGGPERGETVEVVVDSTAFGSGLAVGDDLRVLRIPLDGSPATYAFLQVDRGPPLTALAVSFALAVVVVARLRGLLALVGLGLSFLVILEFMLPALLLGDDPLLVGVVGAAAIMFVVLYLAHGVSIRTTTALVGTLFGLALAALLGSWAVEAARLTGIASEEDLLLGAVATRVDLSGLLLCGIVIAGLGVLNDVTVTQASAVWELSALQPEASASRLFRGSMRIGRDHIASSVYTIAFAYTGAALPALLLIVLYQRPLGDTLSTEAIAQELVSTLVGAIGLVLAVPLTTAVGVVLVQAARSAR